MFYNKERNIIVGECPICNGHGIMKIDEPVLRNKVFVYEVKAHECPLCEGYGLIEIVEDKDYDNRGTNNSEGDLHSGRGPLF